MALVLLAAAVSLHAREGGFSGGNERRVVREGDSLYLFFFLSCFLTVLPHLFVSLLVCLFNLTIYLFCLLISFVYLVSSYSFIYLSVYPSCLSIYLVYSFD